MSSGIVEPQNVGSRKQDEQRKQELAQNNRSRLVARLLAAGPDLPAFMHDLITVQAIVVNGTEAAAFVLDPGPQGAQLRNIAHIRPDSSDQDTRAAALSAFSDIVGTCLQQGKDGVIDVGAPDDGIEPQFCLVTLLRNGEQIVAASAVVTRCRDQERAQQRLDTMRLVAGYFDMFMLKRANEQSHVVAQNHQDVLQAASAFATGDGFQAAAMNLCNELSARVHAARVSLGWMRGRHVKLEALSHTEQFDKKQELSVQIVKVMEECADQGEVVQFDPEGTSTNNITRSAQALSKMESGHRVISLPLRHKADVVGVITLEFAREREITPATTTGLAVAAEVLAPQLYDRYQNDRYLVTKTGLALRDNAQKVVMLRQHTLAKVIILAIAGLLAFVCLYSPMYRVKAPFQFVSADYRVISSPYPGKIDKVFVKPGDPVKPGTQLLKLDTTELELKRIAAQRQADKAEFEAQQALADPNNQRMAEYRQAKAAAEASRAEAALYEEQIKRSMIKSPIGGIVLRGDMVEREGSDVKVGDQLFEVGDPRTMKAEIRVADQDVQRVFDGGDGTHTASTGELVTKSAPTEDHNFVITRIVPTSVPKEGQNVFLVYAKMTDQASDWQPGMEGEARINWEKKPLIWHGTHRLWDWLRLKLWM